MINLLLTIFLSLAHQSSQSLGYLLMNQYPNREWPNNQSIKCFHSQGISYLVINMWIYPWNSHQITQVTNTLTHCHQLQIQITSIMIPIYYSIAQNNPPKVVMNSFASKIKPNLYNFIWFYLDIDEGEDADCSTLRQYISECLKLGKKCGFIISNKKWDIFSKGYRTYCPEISTQPLMFQGNPQDFTPMGGWSKYDFIFNPIDSKICNWSHTFTISI